MCFNKIVNKVKDITGLRFGKLTIIKSIRVNRLGRDRLCWECVCDCGNVKIMRRDHLIIGKYLSCGCSKKPKTFTRDEDGWVYNRYKDNAIDRNKEFNLDFEYFCTLIHSNCFYCNSEPSNGKYKKYMGVDRKDNTIGYEPNNVVPCCKICNFLKRDMSFELFITYINKIYNHINK